MPRHLASVPLPPDRWLLLGRHRMAGVPMRVIPPLAPEHRFRPCGGVRRIRLQILELEWRWNGYGTWGVRLQGVSPGRRCLPCPPASKDPPAHGTFPERWILFLRRSLGIPARMAFRHRATHAGSAVGRPWCRRKEANATHRQGQALIFAVQKTLDAAGIRCRHVHVVESSRFGHWNSLHDPGIGHWFRSGPVTFLRNWLLF